jgi:fructosamine-3-kinase
VGHLSWATITRSSVAGRPVAIKHTAYDARVEADGLRRLAKAGAPVPEVLGADSDEIVMAWVAGLPDWEALGATLALVHRTSAPAFGYEIDNVIGSLPQPNPWTGSWGEFFAENRVRVHLDDPSVPAHLRRRLEAACDGPLPAFLEEHAPVPSLVHGDIWSGNIIDGAFLIDPAVSFSDREVELAFMAVFGGIPQAMWTGYLEAWPLDDGWERRRLALQLHHLLVHVRLFGGGYVRMVEDRLDRLGW